MIHILHPTGIDVNDISMGMICFLHIIRARIQIDIHICKLNLITKIQRKYHIFFIFYRTIYRIFFKIYGILHIRQKLILFHAHMRLFLISKKSRIKSPTITITDIPPNNRNILTFTNQFIIETVRIPTKILI